MKVLFATDRLHVPDDFSGSVQSTHALVQGLLARDHECLVLASLPRRWRHLAATAVYRASRHSAIWEWTDHGQGYPVIRGSQWRFPERVADWVHRVGPDVLVLDSIRQVRRLEAASFRPTCPIGVVNHDVLFARDRAALPFGTNLHLFANSPFTADAVRRHFCIEPTIVPPVVWLEQYRTPRPDARHVTLVSPHPRKGLDLVLEVAHQLPEIRFLLVAGWLIPGAELRALGRRLRDLPNVTFRKSSADMRPVYGDTRVLLVPSRVAETFGRVVVEAQVSGIPVIVSDIGALPWVVGDGGLVLPADSGAREWASVLVALLHDSNRYDILSRAAVRNAARADFQPEVVVARFERALRELARGGTGTSPPEDSALEGLQNGG